jgi:hypothetical protein
LHILKYEVNRSDYNKHEPQSSSDHGRLVTILLYLFGAKLGGQTVFPRSEVILFFSQCKLEPVSLSLMHIYIPCVVYFSLSIFCWYESEMLLHCTIPIAEGYLRR